MTDKKRDNGNKPNQSKPPAVEVRPAAANGGEPAKPVNGADQPAPAQARPAATPDAAKAAVTVEPAKPEAVKLEPPKPDAPRPEAAGTKPPEPAAAPPGAKAEPPKAEPPKPAAPATPAATRPPAQPAKNGMATLALVVALAAAGGAGYAGYQWQQAGQQLAASSAAIDARVQEALGKAAQQQTAEVQALKAALADARKQLDAQLAQAKQVQEAALAGAQDKLDSLQLGQRGLIAEVEAAKTAAAKGDVNALALSEVGYLLRLADHKLHLEREPLAALQALELAERRLNAVNELAFASVSRMLAENVAAVRGVQLPDTGAISARVIELEAKVDGLKIKPEIEIDTLKAKVRPQIEGTVPAGEAPWYERFAATAWDQIKDIVVIRNERTASAPMMAPKEAYFLHQNLRLTLESLRLALLGNDAVAYQQGVQQARAWLGNYFDAKDAATSAFAKELDGLAAVQLNPYLPDLSGTTKAFEDVLARRQPVRSAVATEEAKP